MAVWRGGLLLWHSEGDRTTPLCSVEFAQHGADCSTLLLKINRKLYTNLQLLQSPLRVLFLLCSLISPLRLGIHGDKCHDTGKLCHSSNTPFPVPSFECSILPSARLSPCIPTLLTLLQVISSVFSKLCWCLLLLEVSHDSPGLG